MQLSWDATHAKAFAFSRRWKAVYNEKSEAQNFVREFLIVFGVTDAAAVGRFEKNVPRKGGTGYMDYFGPGVLPLG